MNIEIPSLKSLYIEMFFGETLLSSGTATLVANDKESICTLITNRHNVTGRHQETGKCLNRNAAIPDNIVIHFHENIEGEKTGNNWKKVKLPLYRDDDTPFWIEHPTLGEKADIVALNLTWGSDVVKMPYYLKGSLDSADMLVGPAEPVSVIGFPFGLSSYGKLPIWATGFMAQELDLISSEQPVFLIDSRTRQGQSGSPVIAYRPSGYRSTNEKGLPIATMTAEKKWEFLGIYSGRVNPESDLGKVWHVSAIRELYNEAEKEMERRNKIAENNKLIEPVQS